VSCADERADPPSVGIATGPVPGPSHRFSRKAFADGQAVWSWRPDAGAKFLQRAMRASGVTVARKPGSPRRARSTPSNHRAGKAGCSRLSLWFLPRAFLSARGPRVSVDTRPSLRPLDLQRVLVLGKARATTAARTPAHAALARRRIGLFDNRIRTGALGDVQGKAAPRSGLKSKRGKWCPGAESNFLVSN
jgi:hypothetical protein